MDPLVHDRPRGMTMSGTGTEDDSSRDGSGSGFDIHALEGKPWKGDSFVPDDWHSLMSPIQPGRNLGLESEKLSGPVRTVSIEKASYTNRLGKWLEGRRRRSASLSFDLKGRMIEEAYYEPVRHLQNKHVQGQGGLEGVSKGAGLLKLKKVYTYDQEGKLAEEILYDSDASPEFKTTYTYSAAGYVQRRAGYRAAGSLAYEVVYTYDEESQGLGMKRYNGHGALQEKGVYVFDQNGRIMIRATYEPDGSLSSRIELSYDRNGNASALYVDDAQKQIIEYDSGRKVTEKASLLPDGSVRSKIIYTYDDADRLIQETICKSVGTICDNWLYTYETDKVGNWIRRTKSKWLTSRGISRFDPHEVTYRKITYYREDLGSE